MIKFSFIFEILNNILVKFKDKEKENFIVKLSDYACSKQLTNSTMCMTLVGTPHTMAPEIMEGNDYYDDKCDLWSIGVIIYQLFFGNYPYTGKTEVSLLKNIINLGQKNLKYTDNKQLDNLIRGLLVKDQKNIMAEIFISSIF